MAQKGDGQTVARGQIRADIRDHGYAGAGISVVVPRPQSQEFAAQYSRILRHQAGEGDAYRED